MKSKQTKRALISSALALVLCFVMLLGTTFAWFTDNASTSVNKVQAGTLGIKIQTTTDGTNWTEVGDTLNFIKADGDTKEEILWEPGATYKLPTLRVTNTGNLALKYKVVFTPDVKKQGDEKLAEVLDVNILKPDGKILKTVGTLAEVMNATENDEDHVLKGNLGAGKSSDAYYVSLTMQSSAGNAYQGMTIDGIAITVYAAQDTVESDSNNNKYDASAKYPDPISVPTLIADLKNRNSEVFDGNGGTVTIADTDGCVPPSNATTTPDDKISVRVQDGNIAQYHLTVTGTKTFKNTTFAFSDSGENTISGTHNSNGDVTRAMLQFQGSDTANIVFENCTFVGVGVETYQLESATFKNCTWENVEYGRYALHWNLVEDLTVENCTFDNCAGGIYVRLQNDSGLNVNITGNTFTGTNGHAILFGGTPAEGAQISITNNDASGWDFVGWTKQGNKEDGSISETIVKSYVGSGNTYENESFTEDWTGKGYNSTTNS